MKNSHNRIYPSLERRDSKCSLFYWFFFYTFEMSKIDEQLSKNYINRHVHTGQQKVELVLGKLVCQMTFCQWFVAKMDPYAKKKESNKSIQLWYNTKLLQLG